MNKTLIFGHKNPDTDTICSAIVYSMIKNQLNCNTQPVRLGSINDETQFVLDYLKLEAPELIENVKSNDVILVDHNEFNQSADGIEEANILEVIDHHRIANFKTSDPIYMNVQPVGCTATVLYEIAKNNNINITKEMATLMLSAIISDSLLFKSPTCTKKDIDVANELSQLVEFDINEYGLEMLKAGTNLLKYNAKELINIDSKKFETEKGIFEVAQVNTVSIDETINHFETELKKEINQKIIDNKLDLFVFLITDIVNSNSLAVVYGDKKDIFEESFSVELSENKVILNGVVSRKKQIVPFL